MKSFARFSPEIIDQLILSERFPDALQLEPLHLFASEFLREIAHHGTPDAASEVL